MTKGKFDQREDEEEDRIYRFVGKYVVTFQWMEAQLDQILLMVDGEKNFGRTQAMLANMRNVEKIDAVERVVMAPRPFDRKSQLPGWIENFATLIKRLRQEGRRRNGIVHSVYLFDFVKAEMPPMRSNRRKKDGLADFEREDLDNERTESIFKELALLAIDLSQARIQLVHWHTPARRAQ